MDGVSEFLGYMGNFGTDLLELPWSQAVLQLFSYLGWTLFVVGGVVAVYEIAIEYQNGRADIKGMLINLLKSFFAVSLFTILPIRLYTFCNSVQVIFTNGLTDISETNALQTMVMSMFSAVTGIKLSIIFHLITLILMVYAIIKVLLSSLKRGGILMIEICVGALYMFSLPRGYWDAFINWCKQIVGICFTSFLQASMLISGLMISQNEHLILGLGILLASSEIPRIAQQFSVDTSMKGNVMSVVYAVQGITRFVGR